MLVPEFVIAVFLVTSASVDTDDAIAKKKKKKGGSGAAAAAAN